MKCGRYGRAVAAIGGTLALLAAAAACGGSASSESGGNTLRVVAQAEPGTLNPAFSVLSDRRVWGAMFDRFVGRDAETLETTDKGLLPSWERTSPTKWKFEVRDGVTFHNGEKFDAQAAAFTIKEWRDNPESIWRNYYSVVKNAVAKDGDLVITTTKPYAALPRTFTTAFAVPPQYYQKVGPDGFARKPVGTGPYKLASYNSGQSLDVERYDKYWRGEPPLDGIKFTWNQVASSRYALLASGDVDFAIEMQPQDVKSIKSSDNLKVALGETTYGQTLFMNALNDGPLQHRKLREAVALALDRQALVDSVFQGSGAVPSSTFIGDLMQEPIEVTVDQDLGRAKELVSQFGNPTIVFGYTSGKFPNDARLGQAVASMLETAGFQVEERAMEYGRYRELRTSGDLDIFMQEISATFPHPDTFLRYFVGEDALIKSCINGEQYDSLKRKALAQPSIAEGDPFYAEIEKRLIGQDYCYAPLMKTVYSYGMSQRVEGFEAPKDASPDWFDVSLK